MIDRESVIERSIDVYLRRQLFAARGYPQDKVEILDAYPTNDRMSAPLDKNYIAIGWSTDDGGRQAELGTSFKRRIYTFDFYVFGTNRVWGKNLTIRHSDIAYGGWDFQHQTFTAGVSPPNAVQINGLRSALAGADGAINLTFARVLGHASMNLTDQGTAAFRIRSVVVAQDITGSFAGDIDNARDADVTLLDQLHAYQIPSDRAVPLGVNRGKPVVLDDPDAEFSRAMRELAKVVLPKPGATKKRGLLRLARA